MKIRVNVRRRTGFIPNQHIADQQHCNLHIQNIHSARLDSDGSNSTSATRVGLAAKPVLWGAWYTEDPGKLAHSLKYEDVDPL